MYCITVAKTRLGHVDVAEKALKAYIVQSAQSERERPRSLHLIMTAGFIVLFGIKAGIFPISPRTLKSSNFALGQYFDGR